ncbi:nuclear pore complex protein NUP155 isoform X1 [Ziziphus jujuba]|uniref:Nuclear pore complex protein NUP155 isoform X1 n=1 Tax=Ziziphus jujuba TaxID=326968 RepID=A0ABM3I0W8_ZIZJJ|nr:nuclear pore complex protein NUP155 isoform X1 [Ziziphus jujuba]XP_048318325.2 nuclear pore complex protein NUP155 isoform X1 [Ziziphus jujuba]XP_048318326.2 nuclear pore complex protein NUP155 isoform X1 [Ziziphus jujuba]XP_048318327.2 nuclear pore complex protein NUP155 isoform X1 [Ziziphus jujuba]XP_048318328.2 nuclear pore complex protein NUP155 isoform X1 [Ziziphus jujuba]
MSWEDEIVLRDVTNAGVVVSDRIGREAASQLDLEEALEASRYASHPYSSHPREWPPLVEVLDTWELPPVLIERYNAAGGEGTALCGVFPEIRRAWASVDNSLFLWRFDKWDGQCPEYSGEEQAICAVGLAKSKPGVFIEAIQYLLVLATPVELILVGVCCSRAGDGTDPYAEVSLQPLPEYTVPSDGVTMTCITCTNTGRIFLAGRDGHIYELHYTTGSGWQKRCRKICLTAGFGSVISRWVVPNVFKFGAIDPIVEMVFDNERNILYARTEDMKLQVFILGPNGDGPLKKVAEERNVINQRETHYGGRQSTGPRGQSRPVKPSIVCISPLSTLESKWLHLVAVLSDGRRMYLTTSPSSGNLGGFNTNHHKPTCLKVVATRPSPPLGVSGGLVFGAMSLGGRPQNEDLSLKVETAYYSAGTLVLSDSSPPTMSSLLFVSRDSSSQSSSASTLGTSSRSSRALRESVSSLPLEGRMLFVADVLPLPDTATTVQSLYSEIEFGGFESSEESCEKASGKLWARGDLSTQHILPRRRIVVFSTMGMMEIVFNRPVDILRRLFESNSPRSILDDFFNRFGAGEAAAMCLMLAARIVHSESLISNTIAEKAAEAFEDPRFVGMPQLEGSGALSNTRTATGGFSMGQVVQEAEPVFSGAHEGLCLCSSRLLFPLWELPVMVVKGNLVSTNAFSENGLVVCRLSVGAMQVLENKLRSLEKFLRSRRNQRRGLYGCVAGLGDLTGSILYASGSELGAGDRSMVRNLFGAYSRNTESNDGATSNKRQRLPYSPAELAAMEVRAMECVRQLLLRSSEALFLLQLLSQHHITRLVQEFDANQRQVLVQLTFHQLVCSEEGDRLATRLISALMEYYTGPDGRGTVDDISGRLREGCPSYYKESDYKFFLAVECLERAAVSPDTREKENLAREAFNFVSKVPESADLRTVCKRFEDLRFYEAVVWLPLQKAQALDPAGDAFNDQIDAAIREHAIAQRGQCYEIIISALRSLKGEASQKEFGSPVRPAAPKSVLDQASRKKYISQIVQLGVQSPDRLFHEYLYRAMIDLGLEDELLEYGGPDLVPFLQSAGREPIQEVRAVSSLTSVTSPVGQSGASIPSNQVKYFDLLARYYVLKRQHLLAAHVLLRLAERRSIDAGDVPSLEQRSHYLSNAVIQAKNASSSDGIVGSTRSAFDNGLLDLLEGKLAVLRFQIKIKEELEAIASRLEASSVSSESVQNGTLPNGRLTGDSNLANIAREKAKELSLDLKSITQLYNEYAVPFELWEICLGMLYFANYSGDADSSIVRETWARLIDQALSRGGIAEACTVLKRVGSHIYPGDGAGLPLDTLCLHLEKAALERLESGVESVGDEDVARALLAACKGAIEPVLNTYDQLLSSGVILPSINLRLRLLRSVLVVLREWAMSVFANRMGTSATGASLILGGSFSLEQMTVINQGVRDKITSSANRYMTEVRRLALPQSQTEAVYRGFRELEESLISPFPFDRF